jgi:hypothetical protein
MRDHAFDPVGNVFHLSFAANKVRNRNYEQKRQKVILTVCGQKATLPTEIYFNGKMRYPGGVQARRTLSTVRSVSMSHSSHAGRHFPFECRHRNRCA